MGSIRNGMIWHNPLNNSTSLSSVLGKAIWLSVNKWRNSFLFHCLRWDCFVPRNDGNALTGPSLRGTKQSHINYIMYRLLRSSQWRQCIDRPVIARYEAIPHQECNDFTICHYRIVAIYKIAYFSQWRLPIMWDCFPEGSGRAVPRNDGNALIGTSLVGTACPDHLGKATCTMAFIV